MLRALAAGETNPQRMADLDKRQLRKKIPALQLALEGCLLPHHRFLLTDMLEELDHIGSKIARLEQAIEEQMRPYQKAVDAWMTVPGVKQRLAWNLVAEVGPTVDAFPSDKTHRILSGRRKTPHDIGRRSRCGSTDETRRGC